MIRRWLFHNLSLSLSLVLLNAHWISIEIPHWWNAFYGDFQADNGRQRVAYYVTNDFFKFWKQTKKTWKRWRSTSDPVTVADVIDSTTVTNVEPRVLLDPTHISHWYWYYGIPHSWRQTPSTVTQLRSSRRIVIYMYYYYNYINLYFLLLLCEVSILRDYRLT